MNEENLRQLHSHENPSGQEWDYDQYETDGNQKYSVQFGSDWTVRVV